MTFQSPRGWALALIMSVVSIALSTCTDPPPAPNMEEILASLRESVGGEDPPFVDRPPLLIYLDASQSMQGFLNAPFSRFRRALDQLLDRSVSGGYDVSVYKFDKDVQRLPAATSTDSVASASFFVGGETSFPVLFRHIRKERKRGSVAIVMTDLVQSGSTGEQRSLSEAFQEMATDRPEVLLVALRSSFIGAYWPERTKAADRLQLNLRGQDLRSSRPFYVLAIADRVEELEVLRRRLDLAVDPSSTSAWEIDASRPGVMVEEVKFEPEPEGPDATVWQVHRKPESLPRLGRTQRGALWLFEQQPPRDGGGAVRLKLAVDGEIGVASLDDLSVEARRCRFTAVGPCTEPESITLRSNARRDASGNLFVSYLFPRPAEGAWDGYQVRLLPGRANLTRPIDPALWTTDDDTDPSNATRTFKLVLFVDTLINALREPVAFSEQFIFLGRGE